MKQPSTAAVINGETHQRSVRKVRAEITVRADCARSGGASSDGGDDEGVTMTVDSSRGRYQLRSVPFAVNLRGKDRRRGLVSATLTDSKPIRGTGPRYGNAGLDSHKLLKCNFSNWCTSWPSLGLATSPGRQRPHMWRSPH